MLRLSHQPCNKCMQENSLVEISWCNKTETKVALRKCSDQTARGSKDVTVNGLLKGSSQAKFVFSHCGNQRPGNKNHELFMHIFFPDTIWTFPNEVKRREFGKRWGRAPACPQSPSLGSKQKKKKTHLKDESETEGDKQDYLFLKKKKKKILICRAAQQLLAASGEGNEKLGFTWREASKCRWQIFIFFFWRRV